MFLYTKSLTLYVSRILHENFEFGVYIQEAWNFELRDVIILKIQTPRKKQDDLRSVFIYKKSRHFALHGCY